MLSIAMGLFVPGENYAKVVSTNTFASLRANTEAKIQKKMKECMY